MYDTETLEKQAIQLRSDVLRMIHKAGSGHPGGSLSSTEIITALYFGGILNIEPSDPEKPDRDRFIMSKGHCCPVLYSALARRGYFSPENLDTLRQYHSILQGHPDCAKTPGIDMTSGSLGNGLSLGVGVALSARVKKLEYKVYVLLGDGECQEGMVWEAAMCASHHKTENLVAIVDCNMMQINGKVKDIMNIEPFAEKWRSFGWKVLSARGNNMAEILAVLQKAKTTPGPVVVLADTVKGKGVSFMENVAAWHGLAPDGEQLRQALLEISKGGVK